MRSAATAGLASYSLPGMRSLSPDGHLPVAMPAR
ncbi:hypothetical protein GQR50_01095 [Aeromonas hydrophila]|nr:hypothetical protein GQR50_01095 [Aeromonas hydrophila]